MMIVGEGCFLIRITDVFIDKCLHSFNDFVNIGSEMVWMHVPGSKAVRTFYLSV